MLAHWRAILATHPVVLLPQRADPLLEVDEDLRSVDHLRLVLRGYAPSATMNLLGLPSAVVPTGLGDGLADRRAGGRRLAPARRCAWRLPRPSKHRLGTLSDQLWARPLSA